MFQLKGVPIVGSQPEVEEMWAHLRATKPPERLVDARAVFDSMDPDGSGTISLSLPHPILSYTAISYPILPYPTLSYPRGPHSI